MTAFLKFLLYAFLIALIWVGAEWVFEGAVHTSAVDSAFCLYVARCVQKLGEERNNDPT